MHLFIWILSQTRLLYVWIDYNSFNVPFEVIQTRFNESAHMNNILNAFAIPFEVIQTHLNASIHMNNSLNSLAVSFEWIRSHE